MMTYDANGYKNAPALIVFAGLASLAMLMPPSMLLIASAILTATSTGALFVGSAGYFHYPFLIE